MNTETITTDPAQDFLTGDKLAVFSAFVQHGAMTDDELVRCTGIVKGTASPRRNDLVKAGLLEVVGSGRSARGRSAKEYGIVPPERRAEAQMRGMMKRARRRPITDYSLKDRLEMARQLLDMDDVNEAIRQSNGRAWSRLRGRAQDHKGERKRQMQENDAALKEAEDRGSPLTEYYKLRRALLTSSERVHAVRRLVREELERSSDPESQTLSPDLWPEITDLLTDLSNLCDETNESINAVMGVQGDDVIDGEAFEIDLEDVRELPEG